MIMLVMCGLCFGSVMVVGLSLYPALVDRLTSTLRQRADQASWQLGDMFVYLSHHTLWLTYVLSPLVFGGLAWLLTEHWAVGLIGVGLGTVAPKGMLRVFKQLRMKKFHNQLIDGLLLISSSLKAGLSMMQAFTVVAEEMPVPISQEFGLLLKETKMGVSLDEAMYHVKRRIPTDDVNLFVTAVLVARESGGDVTHIFTRLVETLRERKKIKEKIKTLTFMARLQGIIMAMLPFIFAYIVYQMDHSYFQFFLKDPMGQMMLVGMICLELVGCAMFVRFSRSPL